MTVEAEVRDATHLVLTQPLSMAPGSRVVLHVFTTEEDEDRVGMLAASAALLDRAYGSDEPDYSDAGEPL
ncbi:MAG TPA: hypothetical protein PLA50_00520 [Bacteroidia bacterium]|nr:hypothetical protein [Bacteroidia bacterium]